MITDIDIKLLKDGEVVREDKKLKETRKAVHNLKFEVVVSEEKYKSLKTETKALKQGEKSLIGDSNVSSFRSLLPEFELKLIDIDSFAKGNPLIKGGQ